MKFKMAWAQQGMALLLASLGTSLLAGQAAWINGKVVGTAAADGSGADAPKYSSLSLVRANVPGELAIQMAGQDPTDPTRIFSSVKIPGYYLTDVGSQWNSGMASGQSVLAVVETMAPLHGWTGEAYAGAVSAVIGRSHLVSGILEMPDLWLSLIPKASFVTANPHQISLSITAFNDLGGQLSELSLWRRQTGQSAWQWLGTVANPISSTVWNDISVTPENLYDYSISLDFKWPGGGGAGALSGTAGLFSSNARSISGPMAASLKQPTPTPRPSGPVASPTPFDLPQGWLAYPNPVHGDTLNVALDAKNAGNYQIWVYSLAGDQVLTQKGKIEQAGRILTQIGIKRLASGIYLMRINIEGTQGAKEVLPLRKIAILK
jgi:hypothetical protein